MPLTRHCIERSRASARLSRSLAERTRNLIEQSLARIDLHRHSFELLEIGTKDEHGDGIAERREAEIEQRAIESEVRETIRGLHGDLSLLSQAPDRLPG
jgi:hypothetical protein